MATRVSMCCGVAVVAAGLIGVGWLTTAETKEHSMKREVNVERFSVVSSRPFDEVEARVENGVGHPDVAAMVRNISAAKTEAELEAAVNSAVGPTGIMQFNRFDLGEVLRKEQGDKAARVVRLLVGNPLIMKQMVKYVPDAGSYAPVTILIDERADGVHVSYDTMASFLAPYESKEASGVARELDTKIEALIKSAAF